MKNVNILGAHLKSHSGLLQFAPEPKSNVKIDFAGFLRSLAATAGGTITAGLPGLGSVVDFQELLNKQIELQTQLQAITMQSNIERTRHESSMAALRNFRAA